jgi:autotransporter-associated beta strand protein
MNRTTPNSVSSSISSFFLFLCFLIMLCLSAGVQADDIVISGGSGGGGGGGRASSFQASGGEMTDGFGGSGGSGGIGSVQYDGHGGAGGASSINGTEDSSRNGSDGVSYYPGNGGRAVEPGESYGSNGNRGENYLSGSGGNGADVTFDSSDNSAGKIEVYGGHGGRGGQGGTQSGNFGGNGATGGNGGSAVLNLNASMTSGEISVVGGHGGDGASTPSLDNNNHSGTGGSGGDANLSAGFLTADTVSVISGRNGVSDSYGTLNPGVGGNAGFFAESLTANSIVLDKAGGNLAFNIDILDVTDIDTIIQLKNGTEAGNHGTTMGDDGVFIETVRLGDGQFTIDGSDQDGVRIYDLILEGEGQFIDDYADVYNLKVDGGTLNDNNWTGLIGHLYHNDNIEIFSGGLTVNLNYEEDKNLDKGLFGDGFLLKEGKGMLTLESDSDSFTGDILISSGGGILAVTGTLGNGNYSGNIDNSEILVFDQQSDQTLSGEISGTGALHKSGEGRLTITSETTYIGGTNVKEGTLEVQGILSGDIINDGTVEVNDYGTLSGNIENNGELIFHQLDDQTMSGVISGSGYLTKDGDGTLTLTAGNTYSGDTEVAEGKLVVEGTLGTDGEYSGAISNSGTLIFDQDDDQTLSGVISGTGNLTKSGLGKMTLDGDNSYTGDIEVAEGILEVTGKLGNGNYLGNITNSGNLVFNQSGDQVLSGDISGAGALAKSGAGTLTLDGTNTFTGQLFIEKGRLAIGPGGSVATQYLFMGSSTIFDYSSASSAYHFHDLIVHGKDILIVPNSGVADFSGANISYIVPENAVSGSVLLSVNGTAIFDVATNVYLAYASGRQNINGGDYFTLLDASSLTMNGFSQLVVQSANGDTFTLNVSNNELTVVLQLLSPLGPVYDRLKAYAESRAANLAFISQGQDFILNQGFASALSSTSGPGFKVGGFGGMSGGASRYYSGSHVDVSGMSLLAGLAFGNDISYGRLTLGTFFEAGRGDYDSYNSFGNFASVDGKGDISYTGFGILGRYDVTEGTFSGIYAEASARMGRAKIDFRTDDIRYNSWRASFKSSSLYYSLHAGLGYVWKISDRSSLDFSAKFLWTRQKGDSLTVYQDSVRFDDANSLRTRLGTRFNFRANEHVGFYVGAYWEHEFDGKINFSVNDNRLSPPSLKGDTGMGELGLSIKPSTTLPLSFDLSVQGYVGKRKGISGSFLVKYEF